MYNKDHIISGIKDPKKIIEEFKRYTSYKWPRTVQRFKSKLRDHQGVDILSEDWDNLVILDACRYDLFRKNNSLPGNLSKQVSSESSTYDWLVDHFGGGKHPEIVYVTGNPQIERIESQFCDIVKLWERDWDDDYNTALPDAVTKQALKTSDKYPNKRLIIHYVQPHAPFIGSSTGEISQRGFTGNGVIESNSESDMVYNQLARGELEKDQVVKLYEENLNIVLEQVQKLLEELPGKTVVTADHGEAFGEHGIYEHPRRVYIDCLVNVPWLVFQNGDRKKITPCMDLVTTQGKINSEIEKRLNDLGYIDM